MRQDRLDLKSGPLVITQLVNDPINELFKQLEFDRPTCFADVLQRLPSPILRTTLAISSPVINPKRK